MEERFLSGTEFTWDTNIRQVEIHTQSKTPSVFETTIETRKKDTDLSADMVKVGLEQFALRSKESIIVHIYKKTENRKHCQEIRTTHKPRKKQNI